MNEIERREIEARINDVLQGHHPERLQSDAVFMARWLLKILPVLRNCEHVTDKLARAESRRVELLTDRHELVTLITNIAAATPSEKVLDAMTDATAIKALIRPAMRETATAFVAAIALR